MKLPKRVPQHISETASFKLFASKIPDNWIIRDVTERDYGIDCYLELVNENNELSGELALVQLKSRKEIEWTLDDTYTLYGIDIATSNYWFKFPVPVFIFLADITNQELFFVSVHYSIRRNFGEFVKQTTFNYKVKKSEKFEGKDGVFGFKFDFYYEYYRSQFENELLIFLSNLERNIEFIEEHSYQDYHLGVERMDLIYFELLHSNYQFLCTYFNVDNPIPKLREIKATSRKKFGDNASYELYEHDLSELSGKYQKLTIDLIKAMKDFLHGELDFWLHTNQTVYDYVINIGENGELPY